MLFIIIFCFLFFVSLYFRTLVLNIHNVIGYAPVDIFKYIKNKEYAKWGGFGIRMFCGYFGSGKSMLASKFVVDNYYKYKDSETPLTILSNIPLAVPFTQLVNIQQILDVEENTIIFIDECNTLFNARSWKDFPTELVYQLCQNRKKHIMLLMTAPRFHLVDKSIRDVTQYVYQCLHPFWRFHFVYVYDGWEWENCPNINMLKSISRYGIFAKNKYYNNYDSFAIIDNVKKEEFLSKEEILNNRQGVVYNPDLTKLNKKTKNNRKNVR